MAITDNNSINFIRHEGSVVACFTEQTTTSESYLPSPDDQTGSKHIKLFTPISVSVVDHLASPCPCLHLQRKTYQCTLGAEFQELH